MVAPAQSPLETRLEELERKVAHLEQQIVQKAAPHWLDVVCGSISDPEGFDEVLRYGQETRRSDRPVDLDTDANESIDDASKGDRQ